MFQLTVLCLVYFIELSRCGTLQDAELIPEEMRTPGSELLGKSLSLGIGTIARQRRNFDLPLDLDQEGSASVLEDRARHGSGPYYGAEDRGVLQASGVQAGNRYGDRRHYGAEDRGVSQGEVGFYGRAGKQGSSGRSADDRYRDVNRAEHDGRSDAGRYVARTGVDKERDLNKVYRGAQGVSRHGEGVQTVGSKGGHRKGHHKSGFTNSYHKDESGNKSDFYDDDNDEGRHFLLDSGAGSYYDVAADDERAKFRDAALRDEARADAGSYHTGHDFADRRGQKGNFGRGRYFDDEVDYGNRKAGRRYEQAVLEAGAQQGSNQLDDSAQIYNRRQPVALVPVRNYYPVNEPVGLEYYPSPVQSGSYYPSKPTVGRGVALLEDPRATPQYYAPPRDVYYASSGY